MFRPVLPSRPTWVAAAACISVLVLSERSAVASGPDTIGTVDAAVVTQRFEEHCFGCHGYGAEEGGLNFDDLAAGRYGEDSVHKWESVWKNLRSQTMPPADEARPPLDWQKDAIDWIGRDVFLLDPKRIDPGRVVLRRLNRSEYRHTIHELLGVEFDASEEFPADDTGYGFDTIGEVLGLSPLLLEKYLAAADNIVDEFMPYDGPAPPQSDLWGNSWYEIDPSKDNFQGKKFDRTNFDKPVTIIRWFDPKEAGTYRAEFGHAIDNAWTPTKQTGSFTLTLVEGEKRTKLIEREMSFKTVNDAKPVNDHFTVTLPAEPVRFEVTFTPGNTDHASTSEPNKPQRYHFRLHKMELVGPLETKDRKYSGYPYYKLNKGPLPQGSSEEKRREQTRNQIEDFAKRAFRRPIDEPTLDRLTDMAVARMEEPGMNYERGLAVAFKAILSSPRFLFRSDVPVLDAMSDGIAPIDDYSLASRLSYFLWSRCPDDDLLVDAREGTLRQNLDAHVDRMLAKDYQYSVGAGDFVGQWLQTRDLQTVDIDTRFVTRDRRGDKLFSYVHRDSFEKETHEAFEYVFRENRPLTELIEADYTFLNKRLAEHYGLPSDLKDVDGKPLHDRDVSRVKLPPNSHRGGILRQGTMLLVTSNPRRTSPVKRGLFVLENILGTPAPPAPADVPELEAAAKELGENATLRETLEAHRSKAECSGCHSRMDPLGLALDSYDPIGRYRTEVLEIPKTRWTEHKPALPIDPAGTLMTGESFQTVDEMVHILATDRKLDFYRCLTEKMLTYALGRGLTYRDGPTIDAIVAEVDAAGGSSQTLLKAIVRSRPFTHMRVSEPVEAVAARD